MALDKTVLGPLIKASVDAVADKTDRDALYEAIADAVIQHIKTAAQISGIVVTVTTVSGVTPGPGVSGPGTGTGTAPPGSIS